jgi:hypothetical protein
MNERRPLPLGAAARAVARSVVTTGVLLARRRVHLPRAHVGIHLSFADGTTARVYRGRNRTRSLGSYVPVRWRRTPAA